jgi:FMN reductase
MSPFSHFASRPFIVGIGGTARPNSSSELAVRVALQAAETAGAETVMFDGPALLLPLYDPTDSTRTEGAMRLVSALRSAHGIIIGSPGYHGSMSGLIKNALDYTEDMRDDDASYFDGRAVGCIATAAGWQATGTTLSAMRSVVHALRGWNTPLGVAINSAQKVFEAGVCVDEAVARSLTVMAHQVVEFAHMRRDAAALRRSFISDESALLLETA